MSGWIQSEGIAMCVEVEKICPHHGFHVALTGVLLYKKGRRKDCDLIFYRIRQVKEIDMDGLWEALKSIGLIKDSGFGWCYKCNYLGRPVDCMFPEEQTGEYEGNPEII